MPLRPSIGTSPVACILTALPLSTGGRSPLHPPLSPAYRHGVSRFLSAVAWTAASLMWLVVTAAGAPAADVHGDDEADQYVGSGGLILPGTVATSTRSEVASCLGCGWRLTSPCVESDAGNPFSGTPICLSVVRGCPDMAELLRAWFRPAGGSWREIGLVCIGEHGPVTIVGLEPAVRDRLVRQVPGQRATFQPRAGVVTQLPVVFDSGQPPGGLRAAFDLMGESVVLEATPSWRWEFGDGAARSTTVPGGPYPNMDVAHIYRVSRGYLVRMVTTWAATFTVDGMGPFPVTEPVRQTAELVLSVGEGRAVLAGR